MPDPISAPELPENPDTQPPKKPANKPADSDNNLDETVSEINKELEAMAPGLEADDIVAISGEDEISLDDKDNEDLLSDELADEIEAGEDDIQTVLDEPEAETRNPTEAVPLPVEDNLEDDALTSEAIDEIVAEEGDKVLEAEDRERDFEAGQPVVAKKQSKLGTWLKDIWANPKKRWIILGSTAALLLAITLIPHSRYFVLNTAGVRSSVQLTVIDGGTLQPLKNVTVRAGGSEATTDSDGFVKLEKARLGSTLLQIEKRAFAPVDKPITIGWGSNPLGEFKASAVGTQYTFFIKDHLSAKPIDGAEATSGDGNARSDEEGKIVLTLDTVELEDESQITIEVSAGDYRSESLNITVNNKEEQSVEMVPSRKHVYVSKRSGKYDVYTAYTDGKDEERIVGGTGYERDDIALLPHPKEEVAAFVATRENTRNPSGYLLSTLYILNTKDGELTKIDQSEQIQVVGWSSAGRLVYVKIAAGASGTDPERHRLMSFNNNDFADTKELASSNSFNDVMMVADRIYYAPSNMFQESPTPGTFAIDSDGKNQQTILDKEVYTMVRPSYSSLQLSTGSDWYTYEVGSQAGAQPSTAPSSQDSRLYIDNPANKQSLWVDNRDGKGVLLSYDIAAKEDSQLASRSGLKLPAYWLNDKYAVFRVRDSRETSDYILNIEGGEAKKITDATDSAGVTRWFYY